jgi:hypothetical protein
MKGRPPYSSIPIKRSSGCRTQQTAERWRRTAILAELKKAAGPKVRATMGSFGVPVPKAQGISVHCSSPGSRGTLDGSGGVARASETVCKRLRRKQR